MIERYIHKKDWESLAVAVVHLKYLDNIEAAARAKEHELSS
jgi:hypothetical protein